MTYFDTLAHPSKIQRTPCKNQRTPCKNQRTPKKDVFIFEFYLRGIKNNLIFKLNPPHASLFLSNNFDSNKDLSSNFLINLKKQLEGYILTDIYQHNDDRVLILTFNGNDFLEGKVEKKLILELMGRYNNLILTENNIIIDAYNKNISTTNRSIVPKLEYEYFSSTKKIYNNEINNIDSYYLSKTFTGFSPLLSEYLFKNQNININNISKDPTLNLNNNKYYWFNLFDENNLLKFNSISNLLEHLVLNSFNINDNKYLNFINKKLISYNKRLNNLENDLLKANNNLIYMEYGNYIYSSNLNLNGFYSEFKTYDNKLIKLDSKITLLNNALNFFKIYEKAKRTISHVSILITELNNLINLLNEVNYEIKNGYLEVNEIENLLKPFGLKQKNKRRLNKRDTKKPILKINYNNSIFYIGRNNLENEKLINEISNRNDYWFHIKDAPGSHVILKGELNNTNLEFASMLAAYYSNERNNPLITVNYTKVKDLKKIPNLPAYNVILKNYKSVNIKINNDLLKEYIKV